MRVNETTKKLSTPKQRVQGAEAGETVYGMVG